MRVREVWTFLLSGIGLVFLAGVLRTTTCREVVYPLPYREEIVRAAYASRVDPALVAAVAAAESRFRPERRSERGAIGLMQIMEETARDVASRHGIPAPTPSDLENPETNLFFGALYLRYLLDRYEGDLDLALMAYNAGPGRVDRWEELRRSSGSRASPKKALIGETRHFVARAKFLYRGYAAWGVFSGTDSRGLPHELSSGQGAGREPLDGER
ncbi:MAG: lytic transglycosylase domain-containing protein [Brockia lithotrophica]|nr:lytic transglycosylase domain-containing protein [Brockia lithotrophica]